MKKFLVIAKVVSYASLEVEAKDKDEAYFKAKETDAFDFEPNDDIGDFIILEDEITEIK